MRKIDYVILAEILCADILDSLSLEDRHLIKALESKTLADTRLHQDNARYYEKRAAHTKDLARKIAGKLSVNKTEFLTACGL